MILNHDIYTPLYRNKDKFIILVTGGRGCERPTQEIIMSDLSIKQLKDVKVGDMVLGDDGTPRKVLQTHRGYGQMYEVTQSNGETYYVNDNHILTLYDKGESRDVWVGYAPNKCFGARLSDPLNGDFSLVKTEMTITPIDKEEWCGISLDGNQRYVHSDGTITHNSGKSFALSTFIERLTFELGRDTTGHKIAHQILYSRYTMVSANISIIPEVYDKIEADGTARYFARSKTDIINIKTGSKIMFRGIKTSSGNQTAKLKSIKGLSVFVCDEAEEFVNEKDFETIVYSIRQSGLKNLVIIIMNPTDSNHFIYQRYIKDTHKLVNYDGFDVQISTHPNVLHIHTSYLDNLEHLAPQFIEEAKAMKERDPERYAHIFMGRWADVAEGAIFKKWGIVKEFPDYCKKVYLGMDLGYTCFAGDTLITTMRGEVPIKDVVDGDYVLTRRGYHRVRRNLYNGRKVVVEKRITIDSRDIVISSTNEHKINVNGEWKKYGELTRGDNLFVLSSSTERNTSDTRTENIQTTTITSGERTRFGIKNCSTTQFTSFITERYQRVRLSITRTLTRSTTPLKTLLRSQLANIQRFIEVLKYGTLNTLRIFGVGVSQKRTGTKDESRCLTNYPTRNASAKGAEMNLPHPTHISDSAQILVITDGSTKHLKTSSPQIASAAEKSSYRTNTSDNKRVATNAPINSCGIQDIKDLRVYETDVYDLEVEGVNEYFANGILVHNCDVTAIVKVGFVDNRIYMEELCYKTAMLTSDIIKELRKYPYHVISESADPRMIDEIALGGIIIYPVQKGPGSVLAGLDKMQTMELYVTEKSLNLQEELRNYTWDKDKNGNYINAPIDAYNHLIDAVRYVVLAIILGKVMKPKNVTKERLGIF